MSHNIIINRYWAQCIKCKKVKGLKSFPPSKSNPYMPSLWCKRCQRAIDHPPKAKVKKPTAKKHVGSAQPTPTGISREFLDKLAKTLLPPKRVHKPYVIPPSSTDPSKPRTRTEFNEEFGWFEFYLRDTLVGIGKTEKEALEDSVRRKGQAYSLVPDFKVDPDKRAATRAITTSSDTPHHQGTSTSGGFFLPTVPVDTAPAKTNNPQPTPEAV